MAHRILQGYIFRNVWKQSYKWPRFWLVRWGRTIVQINYQMGENTRGLPLDWARAPTAYHSRHIATGAEILTTSHLIRISVMRIECANSQSIIPQTHLVNMRVRSHFQHFLNGMRLITVKTYEELIAVVRVFYSLDLVSVLIIHTM